MMAESHGLSALWSTAVLIKHLNCTSLSLDKGGSVVKFRCPDEDYALLQRLRNDIISLKADYRGLEEKRDYYLRVERFDMADLVGGILKRRMNEIRTLEKEIALLESACFIEK